MGVKKDIKKQAALKLTKYIERLRVEKKIKKIDVAGVMEINRDTYCRRINGSYGFNERELELAAKFFEIDIKVEVKL